MVKSINTLFAFILFSHFSAIANSEEVQIKGQVHEQTFQKISINGLNNEEVATAELDPDGSFLLTFDIDYDGFYTLNYGRNTAYLYLHPNDRLILTFNTNDFSASMHFGGVGAERNNYLAHKTIVYDSLTEDLASFYQVSEEVFLDKLLQVQQTHLSSLSNFEVENFFRKEEEKSLKYQRLLSIKNYQTSYKFYIGEDITPSPGFYNALEGLDLSDEKQYKSQPYYYYLVNSIWSGRIKDAPNVEAMLDVLRQVKSQAVLYTLISGFYSKIGSEKERAKDYLDLIKLVVTHKPFIEAAEKRYQEVMTEGNLKEGDHSPGFSFESITGEMVSLNDLKGKYVYIDVWATWCGPCIKQLPYLQQLEEDFAGRNIVFVSISVDKEAAKAKWEKMVNDKGLGGIQLFADNSFKSEFMEAYGVNSIPRFILIDPEGEIVNPTAPRPSYEKTSALLNKLLK